MKKLLTLAFAVFFFGSAKAQTTIALQNFESSGSTMTYSNSGGAVKNGSSTSSDRPASSTFYTSASNGFWVNNGTSTVTFANVTGLGTYLNKKVTFRLAAFSIASTTNGLDLTDQVVLAVSLDGGTTYSNEIEVNGGATGQTYWHYTTGTGIASDTYDGDNSSTVFAPSGTGNRTTDGYSTVTLDLPANATQARIRITMDNSVVNEAWVIDDVRIIGCSMTLTPSNNGPICAGQTLNLTATSNAVSFAWTGPNGFTSTSQNPTIAAATGAANGTYTVTATSASGCTASASTTATVNTLTTPTASNNGPVCTGNTLNLTSTPSGATSYTWSGPGGYTASTQNPSRTGTTLAYAGTYTVTVTNGACSATATTTVTVNQTPTASAGNGGPYCVGQTIQLNSSGGGTYAWSGPASFTSTLQNPTRSSALTTYAGTYTVTVTQSGCTASATTTVTVNSLTTPTASNNGPVCTGNTLNLTSTPSGATSYTWSGPGGYTASTQNPSRTGATLAYAGTYTVTVTNGACSASATTTVTVNQTPTASAGNDGPYCVGQTIQLNSSGGGTYAWSGPASFTSALQNPTRSSALTTYAGTYTVTVTQSGCTASATTNVAVNTPPSGTASASNSSLCAGASTKLIAGMFGTGTTVLSNNTNIPIPDATSGGVVTPISSPITVSGVSPTILSNPSIVSVNFYITHTYVRDLRISLRAPDNTLIDLVRHRGGSGDNFTNTTLVSSGGANGNVSAGTAPFTGTYNSETPFTVLNGKAINGTWNLVVRDTQNVDTGTLLNWTITFGNSSGLTFTWTSNPSGFTSVQEEPTVFPSANTTYTVVATGSNGCTVSSSAGVTVLPAPSPSASSNSPACQGTTLFLSVSAANSYQWSGPNGFTSTLQNPSITNVTGAAAGTYFVTVTNAFLCSATTSLVVDINPRPTLVNGGQSNVTCNGLTNGSVQLNASGGFDPYTYDLNNGAYQSFDGFFDNLAAGTYVAKVYDDFGCVSTSLNVVITQPAVLSSTPANNGPLCPGQTLNLSSTVTGGTTPYSYNWSGPASFSSGISNPSLANVNSTNAGPYILTITDNNGCVRTANTNLTVKAAPNATITTNSPVCEGTNLTLGVANSASFQWTGPNGFTSTIQNPSISNVSLAAIGTYTVTVTNNVACTATSTTEVTINPKPSVSSNAPVHVTCFGLANGSFQLNGSGGTSPYTFNLNNGAYQNGTGLFSGLNAGTYVAKVIDNFNCVSSTINVVVNQPAALVVTPANNGPLCSGSDLSLTSTVTGGTAPYSYSWTGPNGFSSGDEQPVIPGITSVNDGTYTLLITDNNNCVKSNGTNLVVKALPTAVLSGNATVCTPTSAAVQLNFTGLAPWTYEIKEGVTTVASGTTSNNPLNLGIQVNTSGVHNYTMGSINDGNCSSTGTGSATITASSTVPQGTIQTITAPAGACQGEIHQLFTNVVPGQNITYSWNKTSGSSNAKFSNDPQGPFVNGPFITSNPNVYVEFGAMANGSTGYDMCVKAVNGCGITNNKCKMVRGRVSVPAGIVGSVNQCVGNANELYSVALPYPNGVQQFNWSTTISGAVITPVDPPLNSQVLVSFPTSAVGNLEVTASLSCVGSSESVKRVLAITNTPAQPGNISGQSKICPGNWYQFSVPALSGLNYNWTAPVNAVIDSTSGPGNSIVYIKFNSNYNSVGVNSYVRVYATNNCPANSIEKTRSVISMVPTTPGNITGTRFTGTCASTLQYCVNTPTADYYDWNVTGGATLASPNGNQCVNISFPSNYSTGVISVNAKMNACPTTSGTRTANLNGISISPTAINVDFAPCIGGPGSFSVNPVDGATSYSWSFVPSNGAVIDNIFGNGNAIDVTWGAGSATINVRALNACGQSQVKSLPYTPGCRLSNPQTSEINHSLHIYPNPAHRSTMVEFYSENESSRELVIKDLTGRTVNILKVNASEGLNHVDLNLERYPKGVYMIEINTGHNSDKSILVVE